MVLASETWYWHWRTGTKGAKPLPLGLQLSVEQQQGHLAFKNKPHPQWKKKTKGESANSCSHRNGALRNYYYAC